MNTLCFLKRTVNCALILAWAVVMLGAYTRLTDAGLGCPDWPGCYGQAVLTTSVSQFDQKQIPHFKAPAEFRKAWTEMTHRYLAGTLVLLVFFISVFVVRQRWRQAEFSPPILIPLCLMGLLIFQAALGMWTVTLKLLPIVVMSHLLGGMSVVALLCYFRWQLSEGRFLQRVIWQGAVVMAAIIVLCQIALGGWVSANYAGIACIGFPSCNGLWWPPFNFSEGFHLFSPVGANYQGGLLDSEARITIQYVHRLGAYLTTVYLLVLAWLQLRRATSFWHTAVAFSLVFLVLLQVLLGIINVMYWLPLWSAVAHNGVAALLLSAVVSMVYLNSKGTPYGR